MQMAPHPKHSAKSAPDEPPTSRQRSKWFKGLTAVGTAALLGGALSVAGASTAQANPDQNNWQYPAPTCSALTVTYPNGVSGNDVNVELTLDNGSKPHLNFHNDSGRWTGTQVFQFSSKTTLPAHYHVTWAQVDGTNYHWTGNLECGSTPPPPAVKDAIVTVTPGTATCDANSVPTFTNVNADWDAAANLTPGNHTRSATARHGHLFADGSSHFTVGYQVAAALGYQSTNPQGACYKAPPAGPGYTATLWQATDTTKPYQSFPQGLYDHKPTTDLDLSNGSPELTAFKAEVANVCGYFQVDVYQNGTDLDKLLAGKVLNSPGNPKEPWPNGSYKSQYSTSWTNDNCPPPVSKDASGDFTVTSQTCTTDGGVGTITAVHAVAGNPVISTTDHTISITFTSDKGHTFSDGNTTETVTKPYSTATGNQSTNPQGACYVPPTVQQCTATHSYKVTNLNEQGFNYSPTGSPYADTRSAGHYEYIAGALRLYTDDASSNAKVQAMRAVNIPATQYGGTFSINQTLVSGTIAVGINVRFVDGVQTFTAVAEPGVPGYKQLWSNQAGWLPPSDPAHPGNNNGQGGPYSGTIADIVASHPGAIVSVEGLSDGSGVHNDAHVTSWSTPCDTYTYDYVKPLTPVSGTPSITVTGPTCTDRYNTITYDIPAGLSVNGFTGKGSIKAEDYPNARGDGSSIYGHWSDAVTVKDGYSYTGPKTVEFDLTDPSKLSCPTTTTSNTPAPAAQVKTLATTNIVVPPAVIAGGFGLLAAGLALLLGAVFYRRRKTAHMTD